MLATDLQDVMFGTPSPLQSEANIGIMKEDHVNVIVHGHEPVLSEMIVATAQKPEIIEYAKSKGATGIQLSGICCSANEILQRHGVPLCGTFLQVVELDPTGFSHRIDTIPLSQFIHRQVEVDHLRGILEQVQLLHPPDQSGEADPDQPDQHAPLVEPVEQFLGG